MLRSVQQRLDAKEDRFRQVVENAERLDDKEGDGLRRAAAHAHVMTHHGLEMDDPDAHMAAAAAHRKVADLHEEQAEGYEDEEAPESSERAPAPRKR